MKAKLNGFIKLIGFFFVMAVYSVVLYLFALCISLFIAGAFFAVYQLYYGFFPDIVLWKAVILVALPFWVFFEVIIDVKVWKRFREREEVLQKKD